MPLTPVPSAIVEHDGADTAAMLRSESSLSSAGRSNGEAVKQRVVLGDICSNRSTPPNVLPVTDIKKLPSKSVAKKQIEELEKLPLPVDEEIVKLAVEIRRGTFSSQCLEIEDIDTEPYPQLVTVIKDIYKYLNELEERTPILPNYMESGYKIKPCMRAYWINWMVEVHSRYKLLQETLYLTVAIMDRFLQMEPSLLPNDLQLVGLTCMFIASKIEERWPPGINDFVLISDKTYTKKEILPMELRILKALDFNFGRPLPLHFLRRYTKAAVHVYNWVDVRHHTLAKYLMELSLPKYSFCHILPSQLAAASLCLSLKVVDERETPIDVLWNDTLIFYSGYTYQALEPIVGKFVSLRIKSETSKYQAIREKYSGLDFFKISTLPFNPCYRCIFRKTGL